MLKLIQRFAASPFSGYALIGILVALAAGGYWFWSELKEFGGLEQRAEAQAETIAIQQARLQALTELADRRQAALDEQLVRTQKLERDTRAYRIAIQEARKDADKATRECMALRLADRLQFGPSRGDEDSQASTGVDG